ACLSKQNAGAFFLPVCAGVLVIQNFCKRTSQSLVWFVAGVCAGALGFFVWVGGFFNSALFCRPAVELAVGIGKARLTGKSLMEGVILCFQTPRSAILPSLAGMIAGPVLLTGGLRNGKRELAMAGWLLVSLPLYQNLFIISTLNEPQN